VQNRQLQSWLSADPYEKIAAEWDAQSSLEKSLKISQVSSNATRISWIARAKAYVRITDALEMLQEIVAADASLQM
jgi:hypothetical protein